MRTCSSATILIPAIGMDAQMMVDTWPASLTNIVNSGTEWLAKILRGGSLFLCTRRMGLGFSADKVPYWPFSYRYVDMDRRGLLGRSSSVFSLVFFLFLERNEIPLGLEFRNGRCPWVDLGVQEDGQPLVLCRHSAGTATKRDPNIRYPPFRQRLAAIVSLREPCRCRLKRAVVHLKCRYIPVA